MPTKTINAGPVSIKPKGAYDSNTTYDMLDEVLYDYDSWYSVKPNNKGNTPADNSTWWKRGTSGGRAAKDQLDQDHTRAENDHTTASGDHTQAGQDHTQALQDHQNSTDAISASETQTGIAEEYNRHPAYIGNDNFWYLYDIGTHAYVKGAYAKGDDLDYSTMTQADVDRLIDNIKADLIIASAATCESIIDELT